MNIAIIGAGAVGATTAYALTLKNLASEVMLIDINEAKEAGEVMDIADTLSFVETGNITRADFKDARQADIIVITAGVCQTAGKTESRLALLDRNVAILKSIFKNIGRLKKTAIVIVVSNPVDILTAVAQKICTLPPAQVMGSGTTLDSARLRSALSTAFHVHAADVSGYVLGEHGNSQFVGWSGVSVGGVPVHKLPRWSAARAKRIEAHVRKEAYQIIDKKGATFYGIATTITDIVEAIVFNQRRVLPVSAQLTGWNGVSGVCLGAPAVVGAEGVERHWPLKLNAAEKKKLKASATLLKQHLASLS